MNPWHDGYVPDKPTSEQIRGEAEKLRENAIKLIEHAKTLIEESAELEKQVSCDLAPEFDLEAHQNWQNRYN